MDFKKKYLKYKNKYLELKGGNTLFMDQEHVGAWSGSCKCPNGETYKVGDKHNGCRSLACENGTSSGCTRDDNSGSRKKMICSRNDEPTNLVVKNDKNAGGWSGTCKCPDGESYKVGDKHTGCRALACEGGVSSECNRNDSSGKYTKVICSNVNQHANYWKKKITERDTGWMQNKIYDEKVLGLKNLNIEDLNELENVPLYNVLIQYIKKGLCGAADGIPFQENVSEVWKDKIKELCVDVHKEIRKLTKKNIISTNKTTILKAITNGGRIVNGRPRGRAISFNFGGTENVTRGGRNMIRGNYPNRNRDGSIYYVPKEIMFLRKILRDQTIDWSNLSMSQNELRNVIYTRERSLEFKIEILFNVGILHHFYNNEGDETKYIQTFTEDLENEIIFDNTVTLVTHLSINNNNLKDPLKFKIDAAVDWGGPSRSSWQSIGKMLRRFYFDKHPKRHFLEFKNTIENRKESIINFEMVGVLIMKSILEGYSINLNLNPYYIYRIMLGNRYGYEYDIDHITLPQMIICDPTIDNISDFVNPNVPRIAYLAKLLTNNDITELKTIHDDIYVDEEVDDNKWPKSILQTSIYLNRINRDIPAYPANPNPTQKLEYLRLFLIYYLENDANPPTLKKSRINQFILGFNKTNIRNTGLDPYEIRQLMFCIFTGDQINELIIKINENLASETDIQRVANRVQRDILINYNTTINLLVNLVEYIRDRGEYQDININHIKNFLKYATGAECLPDILKIVRPRIHDIVSLGQATRAQNREFDASGFNVCSISPEGHTCFNQISIPTIESMERMVEYFKFHFDKEDSTYSLA